MLCSSASIVAPASSRHAGFPFVVGNIPQSAGRSIPRMRPSTRSAAAIVAPVLPAETTASASPCLTIAVATPIDVSPRRRSGRGMLVHSDDILCVADGDAGRDLGADELANGLLAADK